LNRIKTIQEKTKSKTVESKDLIPLFSELLNGTESSK
jgi:hypothetical protein